jgi:hypothetical protein
MPSLELSSRQKASRRSSVEQAIAPIPLPTRWSQSRRAESKTNPAKGFE